MNSLIFGGILAALFASCFALQCHDCQRLADKTCNDPYFEDHLTECEDDTFCVKYKTIVWLRDSGYITGKLKNSTVVTRSCEARQGKSEGCVGWQNNGGITIKCWCGSDGCNSGHSLQSSITTTVLFSSFISLLVLTLRK